MFASNHTISLFLTSWVYDKTRASHCRHPVLTGDFRTSLRSFHVLGKWNICDLFAWRRNKKTSTLLRARTVLKSLLLNFLAILGLSIIFRTPRIFSSKRILIFRFLFWSYYSCPFCRLYVNRDNSVGKLLSYTLNRVIEALFKAWTKIYLNVVNFCDMALYPRRWQYS
jgi:hypothetical protein